jgi:hypothetical protein
MAGFQASRLKQGGPGGPARAAAPAEPARPSRDHSGREAGPCGPRLGVRAVRTLDACASLTMFILGHNGPGYVGTSNPLAAALGRHRISGHTCHGQVPQFPPAGGAHTTGITFDDFK